MAARQQGSNAITQRPTESGSLLAGGIVTVVVYAFHVTDSAVIGALPVIVGAIPTAITWVVDTVDKHNTVVKTDPKGKGKPNLKGVVHHLERIDDRLQRLEVQLHPLRPKLQTELHTIEDELRQIEKTLTTSNT